VTIAKRPSGGGGTARTIRLIFVSVKAKYFYGEDLTRFRKISPSGKSGQGNRLKSMEYRDSGQNCEFPMSLQCLVDESGAKGEAFDSIRRRNVLLEHDAAP
jgi:hypothetical protein